MEIYFSLIFMIEILFYFHSTVIYENVNDEQLEKNNKIQYDQYLVVNKTVMKLNQIDVH